MTRAASIFSDIPEQLPDEVENLLLSGGEFRLNRIVSRGHRTAGGDWYDQDESEWVMLISGSAGLLFEGESAPREMRPGDWVMIPPRRRHRVEWTDPVADTVWLALYFRDR